MNASGVVNPMDITVIQLLTMTRGNVALMSRLSGYRDPKAS